MSNPDAIAYAYHADRNPEGGYLLGVPLHSLSVAEFAELARWQQNSVIAAPFFVATAAAPQLAPEVEPDAAQEALGAAAEAPTTTTRAARAASRPDSEKAS